MADLSAPFLASNHGDVSIFKTMDDMVAMIEPVDALDGGHEFFDARGAVLAALPSDARWRLMSSGAQPQPERLEDILRSYFAKLPEPFAAYIARAATRTSLSELIELRLELARETRPRLGFRRRQ